MLQILNYDLADLYFPMYVLQLKNDLLDQRNRSYNQSGYEAHVMEMSEDDQNDLGVLQH